MNHNKKITHYLRFYKLAAYSFGLLVTGFFMLFIIGEGVPDIVNGRGKELIAFLPFILFPIAGYMVTWFNEKYGTVMILAGAIILLGYFLIKRNTAAALIYSVPFLVSGGLFLLHIKKRRQLQH